VVGAGRETKAEPGAWGNSLRAAILDGGGGSRILVISHATLGELERSGAYLTKADFLAWAATARYITLTEGAGTGLPAILAATALTGGADDRAAITDVHRVAAINRNSPDDNGPGPVAYWGATTAAVRAGVTAHCLASGGMRVAALDAVDTTSPTTAAADGLTMRTDTGAGVAAMFWPWTNVAGITPGTFRAIPPSATAMGIVGRNSKAGVTPNQAPAGKYGESRTAVSLRSQATVTDPDRTTLNNAGVTFIRAVRGGFRIYGARTLVDPVSRPLQAWWSNAILYMAIVAKAYDVMEDYVLRVVDGQGLIFSDLNRDLTAIVKPYWEDGSLFGATFGDAALVVTDASVNTPARLALGELHAVVAVRPGPPAERVVLELVKTGITTNLAG
jgi:phage tail sheath protein FI